MYILMTVNAVLKSLKVLLIELYDYSHFTYYPSDKHNYLYKLLNVHNHW